MAFVAVSTCDHAPDRAVDRPNATAFVVGACVSAVTDRDDRRYTRRMKDVLLKANAVARRLGVSAARVRQMDDVLTPMRTEDGTRIYRADEVERVAAQRDARRGR